MDADSQVQEIYGAEPLGYNITFRLVGHQHLHSIISRRNPSVGGSRLAIISI